MTPVNPPIASPAAPARSHWLKRWILHPIFPLVCIIPLTQAVREQYPFTHYPMYSDPPAETLTFVYVADAESKPLPTVLHSSITPSQVGKKYSRHKLDLIKTEEKRTGRKFDEVSGELGLRIKAKAGEETLKFLRELSLKRKPELRLTQPIRLIEVTLGFGDGEFFESERIVAQLPALP